MLRFVDKTRKTVKKSDWQLRKKMDRFGLELALKAHEDKVKSKTDKLNVILHWCLLKRGLRCVGLGENFAENSESLSELLPQNWTQDQNVYAFKYRELSNQPNKFIFKILKGTVYKFRLYFNIAFICIFMEQLKKKLSTLIITKLSCKSSVHNSLVNIKLFI